MNVSECACVLANSGGQRYVCFRLATCSPLASHQRNTSATNTCAPTSTNTLAPDAEPPLLLGLSAEQQLDCDAGEEVRRDGLTQPHACAVVVTAAVRGALSRLTLVCLCVCVCVCQG